MFGIFMSVIRMSKRSAFTRRSASSPAAEVTTSWPSSRRISATFSAKASLSSTSRYFPTSPSERQLHGERRAPQHGALVRHRASVAPDDPLHQRQPQADALGLGGDQRLEEAGADGFIH